jgi:hypothetical protein
MSISYRQLTPEIRRQVIEMFALGNECREITKRLDLSKRAVRRILAEEDINSKRRNRYSLNEGYFESIDSPTKAYLLGLMGADGCVTATSYIALESIDPELIHLLQQELEYTGEIKIIYPPGGYAPHYRINFSSERLAESLRKQSIFAGRTEAGAFYIPDDQYLHAYVLGYFDGDGSACRNRGRSGGKVSIVGSREFVQELRSRLGLGHLSAHIKGKVHYWNLYGRSDIQQFYDWVYRFPNLGLERKKQKVEAILGSYHRG